MKEDVEPRVHEFDKEKIRKYNRSSVRSATPRSSLSKDTKYLNFVKPVSDSTDALTATYTDLESLKAKSDLDIKMVSQMSITETQEENEHKYHDENKDNYIMNETPSYNRPVELNQYDGKEMENDRPNSAAKKSLKKQVTVSDITSSSRIIENSNLVMYTDLNEVAKSQLIDSSKQENLQNNDELRSFLLQAYDPKFATKIGIKDSLPLELINQARNGQNLQFIPFEKIEKNFFMY